MIGIGLDVVELDRFRRTLQRTPTFGRRVFTEQEVAYAERRRDPTERYAVRFAAKEAVLKAMGVGLWSCPLNEIEVVRADSGEPSVVLHGAAADLAVERGIEAWHLTLTHTEMSAQAIAVAFGLSAGGGPAAGRLRVQLHAADVDSTIAFYEDVLGFMAVRREPGGGARLELGSVVIDVAASTSTGPHPSRPVELVLELGDVEAARRRAARHLPDPPEPVADGPDRGSFRVFDPDGTPILVTFGR